MNTINISLPVQLKNQADQLIAAGHFASFSDLVRSALRDLLNEDRYTQLVTEAKIDYSQGKVAILADKKNVAEYFGKFKKTKKQ